MATTCIAESLIGNAHKCKHYTKKSKFFEYESTSNISIGIILLFIRETIEREIKKGGKICFSLCQHVYRRVSMVRRHNRNICT